jgi:Tfp pilus assembly protein PilF
MAVCMFALENFEGANAKMDEALGLSEGSIATLADHYLLAEILNNLGCLSYVSGQPDKAMELLEESLRVQLFASDHSLYVGSKFSSHSSSLNVSITKANIGYISLVARDLSTCVASFEDAVRVRIDKRVETEQRK